MKTKNRFSNLAIFVLGFILVKIIAIGLMIYIAYFLNGRSQILAITSFVYFFVYLVSWIGIFKRTIWGLNLALITVIIETFVSLVADVAYFRLQEVSWSLYLVNFAIFMSILTIKKRIRKREI